MTDSIEQRIAATERLLADSCVEWGIVLAGDKSVLEPAWHAAGATGRMRLPDTSPADRQPVALSTPRPGAIHGSHLSGRVKGRHGVATRITGDCAKPQHNEFRT